MESAGLEFWAQFGIVGAALGFVLVRLEKCMKDISKELSANTVSMVQLLGELRSKR